MKLYAKKDETEYLPKTVLKGKYINAIAFFIDKKLVLFLKPYFLCLDIIVASRANIVKEGQVAIAYIDQTLVYPKRDDLDNIIIVREKIFPRIFVY